MKISLSATNPCHVYLMARELHALGKMGHYYSGYPRWKLVGCDGMALRTHSARTCVVYGALKFLPENFRPQNRTLFAWQDRAFDRWVGRNLEPCDFIHGIPGQCLETFRAAQRMGIRTVLNHATGPVREWVRILEPEYRRAAMDVKQFTPYDDEYFAREAEEYALADYHCTASSVVREQIMACGVAREKIWIVPYGADPNVFFPEGGGRKAADGFRIVFAGQLTVRKGVRVLLEALELSRRKDWCGDFYGSRLAETQKDIERYHGPAALNFHGPVDQARLAVAFRGASVLVLPSFEEGFGLVVVQALSTGLPCIVSDAVGAKDLIQHRVNGSIVPAGDAGALLEELRWWEKNPARATGNYDWQLPAQKLVQASEAAMAEAVS